MDTACGLSLAGTQWWQDYLRILQACQLEDRVSIRPCFERFRFGGGQTATAKTQVKAPVVIAGVPMLITFCIVDVKSVPLLLDRHFLEAGDGSVNLKRRQLKFGDHTAQLFEAKGGHFATPLHPESFRALEAIYQQRPDEELPAEMNWMTLGSAKHQAERLDAK